MNQGSTTGTGTQHRFSDSVFNPQINPINKHNQMLRAITKPALGATALCRRYHPSASTIISSWASASSYFSTTGNTPGTQRNELTRLPSLLEGCDYEHWLVIMQSPKGYPLRDDIIYCYVKTLAVALGSEEEAKKSIYSVSTKYYYAFGCKVPEDAIYKIKSLADVKWVLPDSYLCDIESSYGGEPFIDGKIMPYDDKYHKHWVQDRDNE